MGSVYDFTKFTQLCLLTFAKQEGLIHNPEKNYVTESDDEDEEDWDSGDSMASLEEVTLAENKLHAHTGKKPQRPTESEERMAKTLRDTEEHMARLITERKEMEEKMANARKEMEEKLAKERKEMEEKYAAEFKAAANKQRKLDEQAAKKKKEEDARAAKKQKEEELARKKRQEQEDLEAKMRKEAMEKDLKARRDAAIKETQKIKDQAHLEAGLLLQEARHTAVALQERIEREAKARRDAEDVSKVVRAFEIFLPIVTREPKKLPPPLMFRFMQIYAPSLVRLARFEDDEGTDPLSGACQICFLAFDTAEKKPFYLKCCGQAICNQCYTKVARAPHSDHALEIDQGLVNQWVVMRRALGLPVPEY